MTIRSTMLAELLVFIDVSDLGLESRPGTGSAHSCSGVLAWSGIAARDSDYVELPQ